MKVDIDQDGTFKYVQIELTPIPASNPNAKPFIVVRGHLACEFHADTFAKFRDTELDTNKWEAECPGGGRIEISKENKTIKIYGYSTHFGQADHQLTQDLI